MRERGKILKAVGRGVLAGGRAAVAGKGNRIAAIRAGSMKDKCGAPLTERGMILCERTIKRGRLGCGNPKHESWLGIQEAADDE
jgi:hypothetical protein